MLDWSIFTDAFKEGFALLASNSAYLWTTVLTSLKVSSAGTIIGLVIGIPLGYLLGGTRFWGRRALMVFTNTGMGFPPVVVGLFVFMLLSRSGPFGFLGWSLSRPAMIVAQVIIATPLIVGVTAAAVGSVPRELRLQARSLGADRLADAWLTLREARIGVMAAVAAGFGGVISEVGAVQITGGNIPGATRTMTTAIVLETSKGNFGFALVLGLMLISVGFAVNLLLTSFQYHIERYERG